MELQYLNNKEERMKDNTLQERLDNQLELQANAQVEVDECSKALADYESTRQEILDKKTLADEALVAAHEKATKLCARFNQDGLAQVTFRGSEELNFAVAEYNAALFTSRFAAVRMTAINRTYSELEEAWYRATDEHAYRTKLVELCRTRIAIQEMEVALETCPEHIALEAANKAWMESDICKEYLALVDKAADLDYATELHCEAQEW
jgi:hypothetical protein